MKTTKFAGVETHIDDPGRKWYADREKRMKWICIFTRGNVF